MLMPSEQQQSGGLTRDGIQSELDTIERAVYRARGIESDVDVHPMDFRLPTPTELKQMREECGMTLQDVADRFDMSCQTFYQIEQGYNRPSTKTLQNLLRLYRMEWPRGQP